jgi:hypothetical protein
MLSILAILHMRIIRTGPANEPRPTTTDASAKIAILFNYLEDPCIATWNAVWRSIFAIFCAGVTASTLDEL